MFFIQTVSIFTEGNLTQIHFPSVSGEENEENCVEESITEPEHDDDSVRVKIADLGNACWVVSNNDLMCCCVVAQNFLNHFDIYILIFYRYSLLTG